MTELLWGRPVADSLAEKIQSQVQSNSFAPKLVTVGFSDAQWLQYANSLKKSGEKLGITVENVLTDGASVHNFEHTVSQICAQPSVNGVLIEQPLPKEFASATRLIHPQKDVDCLCPQSVFSLYGGEGVLLPATPKAVLCLLDFYKIDVCGKNVVVVGRGKAVGKPLALMLLQRNATVTICHTKTVDLPQITRNADIIVSACGVHGLINANCVTQNSIVIDVGLSFVDGKTCGDASSEVYEIAKAVSPVPGGVGPITRMALFENLLLATKLQTKQ